MLFTELFASVVSIANALYWILGLVALILLIKALLKYLSS